MLCELLRIYMCWLFVFIVQSPCQSAAELELASGIREHSIPAIAKAGETGDARYLSLLEKLIDQEAPKPDAVSGSAQIAMAKLGDENQMRLIVCGVKFSKFYAQDRAMVKLSHVGGYRSIVTFASFVTDDPKNNEDRWIPEPSGVKRGERITDAVALPALSRMALKMLSRIVADPPLPPPKPVLDAFPSAKDNKIWLDWIQAHDQQLRGLKPQFFDLTVDATGCKEAEKAESERIRKNQQ